MPTRLPTEIRLEVVRPHIQCYSAEKIAARLNIAPQSARNIIDELRRGDFPEYESYPPYLDDLPTLSKNLRAIFWPLAEDAAFLGEEEKMD